MEERSSVWGKPGMSVFLGEFLACSERTIFDPPHIFSLVGCWWKASGRIGWGDGAWVWIWEESIGKRGQMSIPSQASIIKGWIGSIPGGWGRPGRENHGALGRGMGSLINWIDAPETTGLRGHVHGGQEQ